MHPELESLINIAFQDGILTDKKKEILFRKAETLGVDKEELEMILENKIYEIQQKNKTKIQDSKEKVDENPFSKFKNFVDQIETKINEPQKQSNKNLSENEIDNKKKEEKQEQKNGWDKLSTENKKYIIIGGIVGFIILVIVALNLENKSKDKIMVERDRIENIISGVNQAIEEKNWDKAETLVLQVKWSLNEMNTQGYSDDYDKRREELQELIEKKKNEN